MTYALLTRVVFSRTPLKRAALAATLFGAVAGCAPATADLEGPAEPLGAFRLGYNIVNVDNIKKVEPSRDATPDEWKTAFTEAIDARFGRYDGTQLYHIGISVDGYSIAVTGVPLVATPQSVASIRVWLYDDALGGRITDEPELITVFERLPGEAVVLGSGATQSREQQIQNIAENGARLIEIWMRKNPEWFAPRPGAESTVRIENNVVVRNVE
ncbi:MAG: hypothetical protein AAGB05_15315 [Pseudomonadota bacterium]